MKLNDMMDAYFSGKTTDKQQYIDMMHSQHLRLQEYAQLIGDTEIKSIHIEHGRAYMITDKNITMECNFSDKTSLPLCLLSFKHYEPEELERVLSLVSEGDAVFDIGANHGWYSLNIARTFPKTTIYSFEPMPTTLSYFKKNIELNQFTNIHPFNLGFWNESDTLEFNFYKEKTGATSLGRLFEDEEPEKVSCPVERLDDFVKENNIASIDFIKMDIEGAEFFALQGARESLTRFRPKVFVEMLRKWSAKFNYHPNDIIAFMDSLGYSCFESSAEGLKPFAIMTEDTQSTNFFFLHRKKHHAVIKELIEDK